MKFMLLLLALGHIVAAAPSLPVHPGVGGFFKGPNSEIIIKGPDGSVITAAAEGGEVHTRLDPIVVAEPTIPDSLAISSISSISSITASPIAISSLSPIAVSSISPIAYSTITAVSPGPVALSPVVAPVSSYVPDPTVVETVEVAPIIEPVQRSDLQGPSGRIITEGSSSVVAGPASTTITGPVIVGQSVVRGTPLVAAGPAVSTVEIGHGISPVSAVTPSPIFTVTGSPVISVTGPPAISVNGPPFVSIPGSPVISPPVPSEISLTGGQLSFAQLSPAQIADLTGSPVGAAIDANSLGAVGNLYGVTGTPYGTSANGAPGGFYSTGIDASTVGVEENAVLSGNLNYATAAGYSSPPVPQFNDSPPVPHFNDGSVPLWNANSAGVSINGVPGSSVVPDSPWSTASPGIADRTLLDPAGFSSLQNIQGNVNVPVSATTGAPLFSVTNSPVAQENRIIVNNPVATASVSPYAATASASGIVSATVTSLRPTLQATISPGTQLASHTVSIDNRIASLSAEDQALVLSNSNQAGLQGIQFVSSTLAPPGVSGIAPVPVGSLQSNIQRGEASGRLTNTPTVNNGLFENVRLLDTSPAEVQVTPRNGRLPVLSSVQDQQILSAELVRAGIDPSQVQLTNVPLSNVSPFQPNGIQSNGLQANGVQLNGYLQNGLQRNDFQGNQGVQVGSPLNYQLPPGLGRYGRGTEKEKTTNA